MITIAFLTTDNREQHKKYHLPEPYFGTAMDALLQGYALLRDEIAVHVISCTKKRMAAPERLAPNIWFHQPVVPKLGWGRTLFLGCGRAVKRALADIKPDLVHGQGTERDCSVSAVLSGYPNVLTIHGNMRVHARRPESKGSLYYKMAALLESACLARTDGVVAISRYTNDLVKDLTRTTWLLPNAVDHRYFAVRPVPKSVPRILFVGAIGERKNPLGLLHACEPLLKAGQCAVAIAGDGIGEDSYVQEVNHLAATLPGVEMLGFITRDDLAKELEKASLLVLPTFEDNCPMVVLEAMAAGVPVAASRIGGIPDLIDDKVTGRLFNPQDTNEIREVIMSILGNESVAEDLGRSARQYALSHFHPKVIAEGHLEIYRQVLER